MAKETYFVQVRQAQLFEDLYVEARSWNEAVRKARKLTTLDTRWATYSC
jgi:hypothetical protein